MIVVWSRKLTLSVAVVETGMGCALVARLFFMEALYGFRPFEMNGKFLN
jgi:hypothetical protein